MAKFLTRIFGSRNQRLLRQYSKVVKKINALEEGLQALDDEALKARTAELRQRYDNGESLQSLLPEAFAVAREASVRTLGLRPFDVQLIGGISLHQGKVAEMQTGEGKTQIAVLRRPPQTFRAHGLTFRHQDLEEVRPVTNTEGEKGTMAPFGIEVGPGGEEITSKPGLDHRQELGIVIVDQAQGADLLLTSGGVSVGDFDVVKKVLSAEGQITFWRVRMKPGKPLAFGQIEAEINGEKRSVPVLGMPGNPVSVMVSFEVFARPAILTMLGLTDLEKPTVEAVVPDGVDGVLFAMGGYTGGVSLYALDGELYYESAGEGPAVVLIHGGGMDRRMWDDQFDLLARDFQVVRYDVPARGGLKAIAVEWLNGGRAPGVLRGRIEKHLGAKLDWTGDDGDGWKDHAGTLIVGSTGRFEELNPLAGLLMATPAARPLMSSARV